jgi:FKBP-type peptidyl-prolyl cis-trans isomerase
MIRAAHAAVVVLAAVAAGCPASRPPQAPESPGNTGGDDPARTDPPAKPREPAPKPSAAAKTLASGVIYETTTPGSGNQPVGNDRVTVRYRSWSSEGSLDDIPGFVGELYRLPFGIAEAVPMMKVGEHARLWVPAVDSHGADTDPLVIEVALVVIQVAPKVPDDVAAPPRGATVSKTGIARRVLTPGDGPHPVAGDEVVVVFTGWDPDGTMLETTTWDATARTWNVGWFPSGIQEALTTMTAGEHARFWIPRKMTSHYSGEDDPGKITYDIELLEIHTRRPPPKTPADVAKPPRGAKKTAKGVRYKFLTRAKKRTPRPGPRSQVKVHYSGWTTDGAIFDSSVSRNVPAVFPLTGVIAGWTDVVQVMAPGDSIRAWIPEDLAYKGVPGRPAGMLVFDIELLEIVQ